MRTAALALTAILPFGLAQAPALLAFEVASIKPSDLGRPGLPFRIGPDTLTTYGALKHLIMLAYEIEDYQIAGAPAWAQSEFYDVQAKAGSVSTPHQIKLMLQSLLAERFHLKLNHETRTMSGYILSVDKSGPKLPAPSTGMPPDSPGVIQMGGAEIWSRGSTIKHLAKALWLELRVPVLDETRIEGHYDFKLRFEEGNHGLEAPDTDSGVATPGTAGSIFTALREVGLRLDARKLPIDVLVIENAERPSGN